MEQVIVGGRYNLLHVTSTEYNLVSGGVNWGIPATNKLQAISTPGTFRNLRVELDGVPGTGTYTFSLWRAVGTAAGAVTALTCTVAADGTVAFDTANDVTVAAGDVICLECNPDSPDNARYARWTIEFEGDNANESLILTSSWMGAIWTMYAPLGRSVYSTAEVDIRSVFPTNGVVKDIFAWLDVDPGTAPEAFKFTFRIANAGNGYTLTDTALTCTITADGRTANNVADEIAVAAGDIGTIVVEPLNEPTGLPRIALGMTFVADIDGESILFGGTSNNLSVLTTEYLGLVPDIVFSWNANEALRYQLAQECVFKKLYMLLNGGPGAGNKYTFTVRQEGISPVGGLVVEIADAATTGNDTSNTIAISDGDSVGLMVVPDSSPSTRDAYWGLVSFIEPPSVGWAGGDFLGVPIGTVAEINGLPLADILEVNGVA